MNFLLCKRFLQWIFIDDERTCMATLPLKLAPSDFEQKVSKVGKQISMTSLKVVGLMRSLKCIAVYGDYVE